MLALEGVDVPGSALDVDASLRSYFGHLLETLTVDGKLLFMVPDELMRLTLLRFETLQVLDRGVLARDQLILFFSVERRLLGGNSEVLFVALQL